MIVWTAVCAYGKEDGTPSVCLCDTFATRDAAVKCILDSFYREYEDDNGNYVAETPSETAVKARLSDFGRLTFNDGTRKFEWVLRSSRV